MESKRKFLISKSTLLSSLTVLTIVFTIIFTFVFAILRLEDYSKKVENSHQIIVYINDLDEEQKKDISRKILNIEGVSSLKFESKEVALKAVANEIGLELNPNENPLNDAFYVYLKNDTNLDKLKNSISNLEEVNLVDMRTTSLQNSMTFIKNLNDIKIQTSVLLSILGLVMIYNMIGITVKSRKKEIHDVIEEGTNPKEIRKIFFIENFIILFLSIIISIFVYQYIKEFLFNSVFKEIFGSDSGFLSMKESVVVLVVFVISLFISYLTNYFAFKSYFKKDADKEEDTTEENTEYTLENSSTIEEIKNDFDKDFSEEEIQEEIFMGEEDEKF